MTINGGEPMTIQIGGWIEMDDIEWSGPWDDRTGIHKGCGGEIYDAFWEGGGIKCRTCRGWHCL